MRITEKRGAATNEKQDMGTRIRALREAHAMTQQDLAGLLELTKSSVSRVESGQRGLAAAELATLVARFDISADALLFGEQEEEVLFRADGEAEPALQTVRDIVEDIEFVEALLT